MRVYVLYRIDDEPYPVVLASLDELNVIRLEAKLRAEKLPTSGLTYPYEISEYELDHFYGPEGKC